MKKKKQYASKCIFCGRNNSSNEHILPQWIRKLYPDDSPSHGKRSVLNGINNISGIYHQKRSSNSLYSRKTRKVCTECNNTWLSQIETKVKNIYTTFERENILQGDDLDFKALALWSLVISIKHDLTDPASSAYPPEIPKWIYKHRSMPSCIRVWTGFVPAGGPSIWHYTSKLADLDANPDAITRFGKNLISTGLALGPLALAVIYNTQDNISFVSDAYSHSNGGVFALWPLDQSMGGGGLVQMDRAAFQYMTAMCGMMHDERMRQILHPFILAHENLDWANAPHEYPTIQVQAARPDDDNS